MGPMPPSLNLASPPGRAAAVVRAASGIAATGEDHSAGCAGYAHCLYEAAARDVAKAHNSPSFRAHPSFEKPLCIGERIDMWGKW